MNDKKHPPSAPTDIDTLDDRMGSIEQLDFEDDGPRGRFGEPTPPEELETLTPEREREAGMTGGESLGPDVHEDGITQDDLSPETLLDESGARSPRERGQGGPADQALSIVDEDDIGAGGGLDEEEQARLMPLDGQPEDGEP
ncbi:MAG TPA: phosphotransferase system, HPr-related protein [Pseudomonas sp.]|nr:phosphotransferase system, HPr-related protein [Pseudomonas sp.]